MPSADDESLLKEEAFLRALVANTSEGLLTIDENSKILFANDAIGDILGYRPEELIGSSKMKIIPERLQSAHATGLQQYLETGTKHIDWDGVELPALHKGGYEVPVTVSLREHEYDGERLFTGIFVDITAQKRRERELQEQKRELEEFADMLSHDLRNPLSVAQGYTKEARRERESESLQKVDTALARIEEIIDDMLSQSRYGGNENSTTVVPFRGLVRSAWNSVLTGDAECVLPDETWMVRANRGRASQLIENLIRNAVEHVGPDVTVRAGILDHETGFYLEDDGPGLPPTVRRRMENPNDRTDGEGIGYGLRIVRKVATEHDWELRFAEERSGGARFEFVGATVFRGETHPGAKRVGSE